MIAIVHLFSNVQEKTSFLYCEFRNLSKIFLFLLRFFHYVCFENVIMKIYPHLFVDVFYESPLVFLKIRVNTHTPPKINIKHLRCF